MPLAVVLRDVCAAMTSLQIPTLSGDRLRLEPLASSHTEGMFALWREPAVCEYSGPAIDAKGRLLELPAASSATSDRLLEFWLDRAQMGTGFRWAVMLEERSAFIGAVGFNSLGACAEYAYHFNPRYWGAGLATEASRIALSWRFAEGSESVEAFIEDANAPSIRLAERLGFRVVSGAEGLSRYVLRRAEQFG